MQMTPRASKNQSDELDRLETFFGTTTVHSVTAEDEQPPSFHPRRHHRSSKWADSVTIVEQQDTAPALSPPPLSPSKALLDLVEYLSQLTTEQLENIRIASHHASQSLAELQSTVATTTHAVASRLEDTQSQLGSQLQQQIREVYDNLALQVENVKQSLKRQQPPPPPPPQKSQQRASKKTKSKQDEVVASPPTKTAIALRDQFKSDVDKGLMQLQSMTTAQIERLQQTLATVQQRIDDQLKMIQQSNNAQKSAPVPPSTSIPKRVQKKATAPPQQRQQQQEQQQQQVPKESSHTLHLREQYMAKVQALQKQIKEKISTVSVSVPLPSHLASETKRVVANNPWAFAIAGGVVSLTLLRSILVSLSRKETRAKNEAKLRNQSKKQLRRQKTRFQQALSYSPTSSVDSDGSEDNEENGVGVDSSVFAAVQKIKPRSSSTLPAPPSPAGEDEEEGGDEEEDEDVYADPESWDPEVVKEWETFVKRSRMSDADLWDPEEVDEWTLPQIYVDLDKDRDEE